MAIILDSDVGGGFASTGGPLSGLTIKWQRGPDGISKAWFINE